MPNDTKIAIIGVGRWGKNLLREFNNLKVVEGVVLHKNKELENEIEKLYPKLKIYKSFEAACADEKISAIVISTPIPTHYEYVKKALESGKHVFVEKPISSSLTESEELLEISKKYNLIFFVGYVFLFHSILLKIKNILDVTGDEIISLEGCWNKFGTFNEPLTLNLLSHELSIVLFLKGYPQSICKNFGTGIITNEDIASFKLRYPFPGKVNIYINRISSNKNKIIIIKTKLDKVYVWSDDELFILKDDELSLIYTAENSSLENECKFFLNLLNRKSSNNLELIPIEIAKLIDDLTNS